MVSVKVSGHGAGMLQDFPVGKIGISTIDQKAFTGAHGGKHAGDEIGVVPVVVVGVGKNVDEHVGGTKRPLGHRPVLIAAAGTSVKIRCIQKRQARRQRVGEMQQRVPRGW